MAALRASASSATGRRARTSRALDGFRWLLEELQVSLFAQELKTPFPVSYKRVEKAWTDLATLNGGCFRLFRHCASRVC